MSSEYIDDFFEKLYDSDLSHKHELESVDGFLVGIVIVLIGVGAYLVQILAKTECCGATKWLWGLGSCFLALLILALCCLIGSIIPRFKEYISSPKAWAGYVAGFDDYYKFFFYKDVDRNKKVASEIRKLARQQYIEAGETNRQALYSKHSWQTWAKRFLIGAVVFMLPCAIPIYFILSAAAGKKCNVKPTPPPPSVASSTTNPSTSDSKTVEPAAKADTANGGSTAGR